MHKFKLLLGDILLIKLLVIELINSGWEIDYNMSVETLFRLQVSESGYIGVIFHSKTVKLFESSAVGHTTDSYLIIDKRSYDRVLILVNNIVWI